MRIATLQLAVAFLWGCETQPRMETMGSSEGPGVNLESHRWKHRLLVVFAPDAEHESLRAQRALAEREKSGFEERHLRVIEVVGDTEPDLRAKLEAPLADFRVVLIGKDGGAKAACSGPFPVDELYSIIDAMPMRQAEAAGL